MSEPPRVWTVGAVFAWMRAFFGERGIDTARLDAEVLLSHVLGVARIVLYTQQDRPLSESERLTLRGLVKRRAGGEPVAYLTGEREFWSLPFHVDRRVLVPRPDTEVLIEECLAPFRPRSEGAESRVPARVVDVGTGSGAIAVVLARELPGAPTVFAVDRSAEALQVAATNVRRHGLEERVLLRHGNLLDPVRGDAPFDLVAANLPYITTSELAGLAPTVRDHEPRGALDGGGDGLDLVRPCIDAARELLAPEGLLVLELGSGAQIASAAEHARRGGGFTAPRVRDDYAGLPRVLVLVRG